MGSPASPVTLPVALTVAGSDSGGGAGVQADLKVFFALGCHGTSAVTALTAQNTVGVSGIHEVPPDFVVAQIDAVVGDLRPVAVKTGMLASAAIVTTVAGSLAAHGMDRVVVDPVFVSKHRDTLLAESAVDALKTALFPLASVITPNLYEASGLLGWEVATLADAERAATELHSLGPRGVLVKGGHLTDEPEESIDIFYDGETVTSLRGPRFDTADTHGTGCALSAAIAARLAHGDTAIDAVLYAKDFISGAIEHGLRVGRGYGPVNPGWRGIIGN
ncbi:MAG: bifunctional hydroxymethylpyrimidine kinase/phosphomethylpyrimidine kinase [Actinomycetota bacterium]|nr:bifunctional hydroxymethylpyrimidine kinase/phosphomethylpyrimidine kinase [Actinomycetota bacterium]